MLITWFRPVLILAAAGILCLLTPSIHTVPGAHASDQELRIGIFPRRNVNVTMKMFGPLAEHLQDTLKRKVTLDVPPDIPAFWSRMRMGNYDLVHMNQYHYVRAHAELGWQAVLKNEEFGEDKIAAAIWVRNDSDINSLEDLRGKLIVFGGGDHAMVASIMVRDILQQAGINEGSYIGMSTLHPVKSILTVYYRQADAAGVGNVVGKIPQIREQIDVDELKMLAMSEPVAHLVWALRPGLDSALQQDIVNGALALNDTKNGREILAKAGMTGIRLATDDEYDTHRKIIKRVLGEEY
jgi:phosphonate transport system substrate-binding protein